MITSHRDTAGCRFFTVVWMDTNPDTGVLYAPTKVHENLVTAALRSEYDRTTRILEGKGVWSYMSSNVFVQFVRGTTTIAGRGS